MRAVYNWFHSAGVAVVCKDGAVGNQYLPGSVTRLHAGEGEKANGQPTNGQLLMYVYLSSSSPSCSGEGFGWYAALKDLDVLPKYQQSVCQNTTKSHEALVNLEDSPAHECPSIL